MPEISVIVPVYNVIDYLDRCVDSILNQTFSDFELFLVDDGSTDGSSKKCDELGFKDDRIIVIHKENGGLSDARNAALDRITGEYVSFVDSDDYVDECFLEVMLDCIKKAQSKMSVCNIEAFSDNGDRRQEYIGSNLEKTVYGEEMYQTLYQPSACNKMYHRSLFDDIRYPKGKLFEDCFVYHLILEKLNKLVYVGKTLYYYYMRSNSIMHDDYRLKNTDIVDAVYERATFLDAHGHHKHADEAYLAMYTRLASAYTLLDKNDQAVRARLNELKGLFDSCYKRLITDKHFSTKQKMKIRLFRWVPYLHVRLFPMNIK